MSRPTRRRFLAIAAGVAALPLAGSARGSRLVRWRGTALGAEAAITLATDDPARAAAALAACRDEIAATERACSLHDPRSALSRLNRDGALADPPPMLVELLARAATASALTGGAFDATVQPLWRLHAAAAAAPAPEALEAAAALVDWRGVALQPDLIGFARPGMAATLNGIAQGYATDRVALRLGALGFAHVLADLGELRALGPRPDGTPWQVGVAGAGGGLIDRLRLDGMAAATSAPFATRLGGGGHIFDPRTGRTAASWASVTVLAPEAALADALSTALVGAPPEAAEAILAAAGAAGAALQAPSGAIRRIRV